MNNTSPNDSKPPLPEQRVGVTPAPASPLMATVASELQRLEYAYSTALAVWRPNQTEENNSIVDLTQTRLALFISQHIGEIVAALNLMLPSPTITDETKEDVLRLLDISTSVYSMDVDIANWLRAEELATVNGAGFWHLTLKGRDAVAVILQRIKPDEPAPDTSATAAVKAVKLTKAQYDALAQLNICHASRGWQQPSSRRWKSLSSHITASMATSLVKMGYAQVFERKMGSDFDHLRITSAGKDALKAVTK